MVVSMVQAKRLMDVMLAGTGLVVLLPVCILVALMVLCCDGRPMFFTVACYGRDARVFKQYKFRSMTKDHDRSICEDDKRVTSVGRIIRATALDEIPQLWNIAKGDMSLVGPRPVAVDELERRSEQGSILAIPHFLERCRVRPGLTGFAQLYLPKYVTLEQRFRYDACYVDSWSLWLDVKFFVASVWQTLKGRWEMARQYSLELWP